MDADGVSFGDFGAGSGGGGHRGKRGSGGAGAGGKLIVDQDLMDTWYPDCRECACCKVRRRGVWENSWERKISGIFQDVLEEESSGSKVLGGPEAFGVLLVRVSFVLLLCLRVMNAVVTSFTCCTGLFTIGGSFLSWRELAWWEGGGGTCHPRWSISARFVCGHECMHAHSGSSHKDFSFAGLNCCWVAVAVDLGAAPCVKRELKQAFSAFYFFFCFCPQPMRFDFCQRSTVFFS